MADFEPGWEKKKSGDMSKKERIAFVNKHERAHREREQEEAVWDAVANENSDRALTDFFKNELGVSDKDFRDVIGYGMRKDPTNEEINEVTEILKEAAKAQKGGWFSRGSNAKAKKILKKNKGKLKKGYKAAKKKRGWFS